MVGERLAGRRNPPRDEGRPEGKGGTLVPRREAAGLPGHIQAQAAGPEHGTSPGTGLARRRKERKKPRKRRNSSR